MEISRPDKVRDVLPFFPVMRHFSYTDFFVGLHYSLLLKNFAQCGLTLKINQ